MSTSVHAITFNPNPIQRQFIESRAKADLFSSRMGEGKSLALCWAALYHTRHNPGARWLLVRDTWENLMVSTQKTFFEWFPPGIAGTYTASKKTFTWASGLADGEVTFMGMDDPTDATKLQSRELAGMAIDEPAPAAGNVGVDELVFDLGLSRLRQPGMNWYSMKLAENNPDESHWTYRRFVSPGEPEFRLWQPMNPENTANLPPSYYEDLRKLWAHRPDLVRRFVEGEFGFQQVGKAVTPQWNDRLHLATGLFPIKGYPLYLLWDFGHNPTCIITQKTPLGNWNILDALVGDDIGAAELIESAVRPLLRERYAKFTINHIGDPAGEMREQSSTRYSAVRILKSELGGTWKPGPVKWEPRRDAIQSVLTKTMNGKGLVQVDRHRAKAVWYALRGGWHYHIARTGVISATPKKDEHSHPGDAMSYGAYILFPPGKVQQAAKIVTPKQATFFGPPGLQGVQVPGTLSGPRHGEPMLPEGK